MERTIKIDQCKRITLRNKSPTFYPIQKSTHNRPETIKLLEEDIGETLQDVGIGKTSKAPVIKTKIDKWNYIK